MREIKFRAWCGEQKRMFSKVIVGNTANPNSDDYTAHCIYRDGSWYHVDHHDVDVYFMQYTGLKDANGVEIYEGDIVKSLGQTDYVFGIRQVVFKNGSFTVKGYGLVSALTEVIGNIYENPELLK